MDGSLFPHGPTLSRCMLKSLKVSCRLRPLNRTKMQGTARASLRAPGPHKMLCEMPPHNTPILAKAHFAFFLGRTTAGMQNPSTATRASCHGFHPSGCLIPVRANAKAAANPSSHLCACAITAVSAASSSATAAPPSECCCPPSALLLLPPPKTCCNAKLLAAL